jgi:uncharacterized protein HemX
MAVKKTPSRSVSAMEDSSSTMDQFPEFGARPSMSRRSNSNTFIMPLIIALIVVVVIGVGYWAMTQGWFMTSNQGVKAVFLENGQVYFGKIVRETSQEVQLSDVYYIQVQDQQQPATTEGGQPTTISVPTLTRRGDELHKPYGNLRLNRQHIVAIENVGTDSPVVKQMQALAK